MLALVIFGLFMMQNAWADSWNDTPVTYGKYSSDVKMSYIEYAASSVEILPLYQNLTGPVIIDAPAIPSDVITKLRDLGVMVGNETVSVLPEMMIISKSADIPIVKKIVVSSGIARITNDIIPTGNLIMESLSLPQYTMPQANNITAVLPPILISDENTNIVSTPPVKSWVPYQDVIVPISNATQNTAVSQIRFTAAGMSTNNTSQEWLAVQLDRVVPDSIAPLSESALFLDIKYPYEEGLGGVDWSDPANHHTLPQVTLSVLKPDVSSLLQITEQNCAIYHIYLYKSDGTWSADSGSTITSNESINESFCSIVISFQHFSSYGLSAIPTADSTPSPGSSPATSSGSGRTGTNTGSIPQNHVPNIDDIPTQKDSIPSWVRNVSGMWAVDTTDEKAFGAAIKYLVDAGILPRTLTYDMPDWVKSPAQWWSEGYISDAEFINMLSYIIQNKIV